MQDWIEKEAEPIKVAVVGACGRMGQHVMRALNPSQGFEIVAAIDHCVGDEEMPNKPKNVRDLLGPKGPDIEIEEKLGAALDRSKPDVMVDFSHPSAAGQHALSAVKRNVHPVIGTTGLSKDDIKDITLLCQDQSLGGLYAPNFAIGAVLMMKFAEIAAAWMPDVEIIELHHDKKEDAPSGTAMLTAELISEARISSPTKKPRQIIKAEGARGANVQNVPVHSVRLPGLVAHQVVIFGNPGEMLMIRHDSLDRSSFMEGVKLAVRKVRGLKHFVVGLDHVLDLPG